MEDLIIIPSQSRYFSLKFMLGITEQISVTHVDIGTGCSVSNGPFVDPRSEKSKLACVSCTHAVVAFLSECADLPYYGTEFLIDAFHIAIDSE